MNNFRRRLELLDNGSEEYVDFGLPSGVKWCTHNIGGTNPEDYGYYFTWGNVEGYEKLSDYKQEDYVETPGYSLTGNIVVSDTYDIARKVMGSPWRLPTHAECKELCDNTDREYTTLNGVKGWKFMKKSDHSVFIFFPACGYYTSYFSQEGTRAQYWTSTVYTASFQGAMAYHLYLDVSKGYLPEDFTNKSIGNSGRAVQ